MTSIMMNTTDKCNMNSNSNSNSTQKVAATNDISTKLVDFEMDVNADAYVDDVDTHVDTDNDRMQIRPPPFEFIVECVRQLHYANDQHQQQQHQQLNHQNENRNREECDTENDTARIGNEEEEEEEEYNEKYSTMMSLHDLIYQEAENEADEILNRNENEQDNDIDIAIEMDDVDTMLLDSEELAIAVDVELIERCYLRHNYSLYDDDDHHQKQEQQQQQPEYDKYQSKQENHHHDDDDDVSSSPTSTAAVLVPEQ